MKGHNKSSTSSCNIHPIDQFIEGVCPLCLNEKLLVLACLQKLRSDASPPASDQTIQKPNIILQNSSKRKSLRLFSFFGFFQLRHHKSHHKTTSIISPEDSFISIEFENNKATSWNHQYQHAKFHTKKTETEIVYKPMPRHQLPWRKRIGRLLHVISFKSRSHACHVSSKVKGDDDLGRGWLSISSPTNKRNSN